MGLFKPKKSKQNPQPLSNARKNIKTFDDGEYCLDYIRQNWDVENPYRYEAFETVLSAASAYDDSLHLLACAYACHYSKVDHRKQAIDYFEKFFENPHFTRFFTASTVYFDLGKDYESECDFNNAERCYLSSAKLFKPVLRETKFLPPASVALGRLYIKLDTQKAIDYWESFMQCDEYKYGDPNHSGLRRQIDVEYQNAMKKHEKGYVYKSRKKV